MYYFHISQVVYYTVSVLTTCNIWDTVNLIFFCNLLVKLNLLSDCLVLTLFVITLRCQKQREWQTRRLATCGQWKLLRWRSGSSSKWEYILMCNTNRYTVCQRYVYVLFFYQVICIWSWQIMWHEWKSWFWNCSFPGTVKRCPKLWVYHHYMKGHTLCWADWCSQDIPP